MFTLYPYQRKLKADILNAWNSARSVLAVLPTGAGKTVIFSSIMHDHIGASAAIVHRREIVAQISLSLARLGVKHKIIAPLKTIRRIRKEHLKEVGKCFVDPNAQCGVISVQTLTSQSTGKDPLIQGWLKQITLAVYDEGHHYVKDGVWKKAVECMGTAKLLFVTATPERADGKGLDVHASGYVEMMVQGPTTEWLIKKGYLAPFKYFCPESDLDVKGLAVNKQGDFTAQALRARVVESHIVGDVVSQYRKFCNGKKTVVFATDVTTAMEMAQRFVAAGISAVALSGKTDEGERAQALTEFKEGIIDVLVNVDLFDEGFDVPAIQAIMLTRPTQSLAKFLQQCGRGLRRMEGKPYAIIVDMVRNWEKHLTPNVPRVWSLHDRVKNDMENDDTIKMKMCTECTQPYEAYHLCCPWCGHSPMYLARQSPEQVDGDLHELDVDAMAALFKKIEYADMSDEDYQRDQEARCLHPKGRRLDLIRHQHSKQRRKVLVQQIDWWRKAQPGRSKRELQKRFFLRFGVDMATAKTLKKDQTNALIERIKRGFSYDICT